MQQADLIAVLEEIAPPVFAASWDKSGVQVASSRAEIMRLAVCLDPTPDMVRSALDAGADMLLAHHPLTMEPRYPDRLDAYHRVLSLLLSRNVALYSAHTSLDANPAGPAFWLADELGLTERCLLEETGLLIFPDGNRLRGGFGCVGDLPAPLSLEELLARVRSFLPPHSVSGGERLAGATPALIRRLAVCVGSGASLADRARRLGAELFLTGDLKYHAALDLTAANSLDPERPFAVLDMGHFSLEEEMTRRLALRLAALLPELSVTFLPGREPFFALSPPTYGRYRREPLS
jgi:dinuclear metal center YbgI/SA1388 family protein